MNLLEQRIAIAEANGHTWTLADTADCGYKSWQEFADRCGIEVIDGSLPDYLNDLNAMHEVERGLDDDLDCKYVNNLAEIVRPEYRDSDDMFYKSSTWTLRLVTASAAQRAEAYLRTIGKWKD